MTAPDVPWRHLAGVFLLALAVRGVALWELSNVDPYFRIPIVDEQTNHHQALRIASGDLTPEQPYWKPPLYPHLLALLYRPGLEEPVRPFDIESTPIVRAKIAQGFIDSGTAVLWALLGALVAGRAAGLGAGLIYALAFTPVYFCFQLLDTTLFTHLLAWSLLNLALAERQGGATSWLLAGLLLGLSATTRAPALLTVPIAMLLPLCRPDPWRTRLLGSALVAGGTLFAILPVTLMNSRFGGDAVLISSNGGYNFYVGNRRGDDIGSDGLTPLRPGPRDWEVMAIASDEKRPSARSRKMYRAAFREIAQSPSDFLERLLRKSHALVDGFEVPNNKNFQEERARSWVLTLLPARTGIVFALGVTGLFFLWGTLRHRLLLVGFLATQAFGIVLFFVAARYRVPLTAALTIPAAALIHAFVTGSFSPRRQRAAAIVLVVLLLVLNSDPAGRRERYESYSIDPLALGYAHELRGELDRAREFYELALTLDPDYPNAENNLGLLDLQAGNITQARARFERAIELTEALQERVPDFHFSLPYANLGQILLQQLETTTDPDTRTRLGQRALECLRKATQEDPESASARLAYGQVLELAGELREALNEYQAALRLDPRALPALLVARVYAKTMNVVDAERWIGRAFEYNLTATEQALLSRIEKEIAEAREKLDPGQ